MGSRLVTDGLKTRPTKNAFEELYTPALTTCSATPTNPCSASPVAVASAVVAVLSIPPAAPNQGRQSEGIKNPHSQFRALVEMDIARYAGTARQSRGLPARASSREQAPITPRIPLSQLFQGHVLGLENHVGRCRKESSSCAAGAPRPPLRNKGVPG